MSRKRWTLAGLFAISLHVILQACAPTMATAEKMESPAQTDVACSSFEPIRWSVQDTDQTIAQVKEHNAAWRALCEEKQ